MFVCFVCVQPNEQVWVTQENAAMVAKLGIKATVVTLEQAVQVAADRQVDFIVNFPENPNHENRDYYRLRRKGADYALPIITNERVAIMLAQSLCLHKVGLFPSLSPCSLLNPAFPISLCRSLTSNRTSITIRSTK